jgi:uncharacterized protein YpmS
MTRRVFILMFVLLLSVLACAQPMQKTETPPTRVPPSTEDALALQAEVATASANFAETGNLSISLTEQQMTGFLIEGLSSQPDVMLTEPQVTLQDGQIQLSGKILFGKINVPVAIVLTPAIQNNALIVSVTSANFGIIPIPEKLLTQVTDLINKNLNQTLTMDGRQINVEKVEIANGIMKIIGKATESP